MAGATAMLGASVTAVVPAQAASDLGADNSWEATLIGPGSTWDTIHTWTDTDWYKLVLPETDDEDEYMEVTVKLSDLPADYDLQVRNRGGNYIVRGDTENEGLATEQVVFTGAGEEHVYMRVKSGNGGYHPTVPYKLNVHVQRSQLDTGAHSFDGAREVQLPARISNYSYGSSYYKFNLPHASVLTARLKSRRTMSLELLDYRGKGLAHTYGSDGLRLAAVVGPGAYVIRASAHDEFYPTVLNLGIEKLTKPAKRAQVKLKAKSNRSKLLVDVNPNNRSKNYKITVQKRVSGKWKTVRTTKTRRTKDRRTINMSKGKYRVKVPAQLGLRGAKSNSVVLSR